MTHYQFSQLFTCPIFLVRADSGRVHKQRRLLSLLPQTHNPTMTSPRSVSSSDDRLALSRFDSQRPKPCWKTDEEEKEAEKRLETLSNAFKTIIGMVGEDVEREGLKETPLRAARALCYFTKGYEETIESELNCTTQNKTASATPSIKVEPGTFSWK